MALKQKVEFLEGRIEIMTNELLTSKLALGPWYKSADSTFPQGELPQSPISDPLEDHSPIHRPSHRPTGSLSQPWDMSQPPVQNHIAPLDLSTSLEGSLSGLRQSLVNLASSVDSLGRRSDIALTNETLRLNEEVRSIRASLHGLRMQIHTMMINRNAQVTGRS